MPRPLCRHAPSCARAQYYSAMVRYMDDAVGEFIGALQRKQMWAQTLFAFAADNGANAYAQPRPAFSPTHPCAAGGPIYEPGAANNHPLKGGKFSDWEGAPPKA